MNPALSHLSSSFQSNVVPKGTMWMKEYNEKSAGHYHETPVHMKHKYPALNFPKDVMMMMMKDRHHHNEPQSTIITTVIPSPSDKTSFPTTTVSFVQGKDCDRGGRTSSHHHYYWECGIIVVLFIALLLFALMDWWHT